MQLVEKKKWRETALDAVRVLIGGGFTQLTSEDIWLQLKAWGVQTTEGRAMGGVLREAAALGLIKPTEAWVKSQDPIRHARPVRVWEVL